MQCNPKQAWLFNLLTVPILCGSLSKWTMIKSNNNNNNQSERNENMEKNCNKWLFLLLLFTVSHAACHPIQLLPDHHKSHIVNYYRHELPMSNNDLCVAFSLCLAMLAFQNNESILGRYLIMVLLLLMHFFIWFVLLFMFHSFETVSDSQQSVLVLQCFTILLGKTY